MIDVDIVQRFKVGGLFFLQMYKVMTGTLLALFVPQKCGDHICSIQENIDDSDHFHEMVLSWNILTSVLFIGYYLLELRREEWSIKFLDIDNDKPDNCLKEVIIKYKDLDEKMDRINKYYYNVVRVTIFFYIVNNLLSIRLLKDKYYSSTTLSCFFSFSLLVGMKLFNSYYVAKNSVLYDKMTSAYMTEFVSYNVIDSDYLQKIEENTLSKKEKVSRM
mgnify:CR=1 FL=1|tara:strand:- start:4730 stop:5383 length:654 start_codon:yes stop_codon:yes gene_type:complete